jgi:DNA-binding transcriptional ArsR family regulator
MKNINQRLKRLIETDMCQAEVPEEYRKQLLQLSDEVADIKTAKRNSKFFKALSDEKRVRIIKLLTTKEMCICELMICLNMTQPNLSHHIQILENVGIIKRIKKGKWVYCSLTENKHTSRLLKFNML